MADQAVFRLLAESAAQQQGTKNGLGTASFVLGIVGMAFSLIPFAGMFLALPVAFTGLGVGLGGVYRLFKGRSDNKALTWIGVGLSLLAIVLSIVIFSAFVAASHSSS